MDTRNDSLVGCTLDRWMPDQLISSDGRLDIFAGHGTTDNLPVTIGVLPLGRADNPAFRARFLKECRTVAEVSSPHIAQYVGFGSAYRRLFYVTAGAPLPSLSQRLDAGWQPEGSQILSLAAQIARGLGAVALARMTHRALHPNVLTLDDDGTLRITGFGIAPDTAGDEAVQTLLDTTQPAECMAPEQLSCAPFDGRGDLYSFACIAYWFSCGRPPFIGSNMAEIVEQHLKAEPAPPRRHSQSCPPELSAFLMGLLAKKPADRRPGNILEVMQELDAMRQSHSQGMSTRRILRHQAVVTRNNDPTAPTPQAARPTTPPATPRIRPWLIAGVAAAVVVTVAGFLIIRSPTVSTDMPVPTAQTPVDPHAQAPPSLALATKPAADDALVVREEPVHLHPRPDQPVQLADAALTAKVVARGEHLGPVEDLQKLLGKPDLVEQSGRRLWYAHFEFIVEDGLVLSARQHPAATPKP